MVRRELTRGLSHHDPQTVDHSVREMKALSLGIVLVLVSRGSSFRSPIKLLRRYERLSFPCELKLKAWSNKNGDDYDDEDTASRDGNIDLSAVDAQGFTTKQRLREEIESPFRKVGVACRIIIEGARLKLKPSSFPQNLQVRLFFFAASAGSASIAFYFSLLASIKAYVGGFSDAPPLDTALQSLGVNAAGIAVCGALALREARVGDAALKRIAKGGQLASLLVSPAGRALSPSLAKDASSSLMPPQPPLPLSLKDFRRAARVLIAAGGEAYVAELARALAQDGAARGSLAARLARAETVLIPVLLLPGDPPAIGDTRRAWREVLPEAGTAVAGGGGGDGESDVDSVVCFPAGNAAWAAYLADEVRVCVVGGSGVLFHFGRTRKCRS